MGKYLPYGFYEKRPVITVIFLAALLLAAGCVKFQPQPISPAETAAAFESRTLDNPGLRDFLKKNLQIEIGPGQPHGWNFSMLTLVACYYHPDLEVARASRKVMEAGLVKAGERPNPSMTASAGFISNPAGGVSPWLFGFGLDLPFETAGRRGYRIAQASHLADAAQLNMATAVWRVRSRLRASLLEVYFAKKKEALLNRDLALQEQFVELLSQRLNYGQISRPVLTRAQISLDQMQLLLRETQMKTAEYLVTLAEALGLPAEALKGADISYAFLNEFPAEPPSPEMRRQALLNRPDILSALAAYEAGQSALQLEIARQYPDIHLGPGYHFDDGENKWTIGLMISLPVLNRNQGAIAEAEARRAELAARFAALQARVVAEIDQTLAGFQKALQTLQVAENLYRKQENEVQSVQARLDVGQDDRLALLSARLRLAAISLSQLKALYDAQRALGQLEDAFYQPLGPAERS